MSKPQSKTGVPHLVFQAKTGFQYYYTFPKHFSLNPMLPAQIRWSLGYDEALARDLAKHLNLCFLGLLKKCDEDRVQFGGDIILRDLGEFHDEIKRILLSAHRVWGIRPSPHKLSAQDLNHGHERLMNESQAHPVLFTGDSSSEIHFALFPSKKLMKALNIGFTRFDWPLGTSDQSAAHDAAVYIYSAITALENLPITNLGHAAG